jgi:hypothetical protein
MLFIISLISLYFLWSAFFTSQQTPQLPNSFFAYYHHEIAVMSGYIFPFVLTFIILTIIFYRSNFDKQYSAFKIASFSAVQTLFVVLVGFVSSYILLLIIAVLQLNLSATIINMNPKLMGVEDDENIIFNRLQTNLLPPQVIASEQGQTDILRAIASATTGTTNFYGSNILPTIPNFLIFSPDKLQANMLLLDSTLIITKINAEDMQIISPLIGYRFVKSYFPFRKIKTYPKVTIMSR